MTPIEQARLENMLFELQSQHRDLDQVILQLSETPNRDALLMQRLKKRKLRLKDQIERIRCLLIPDIPA